LTRRTMGCSILLIALGGVLAAYSALRAQTSAAPSTQQPIPAIRFALRGNAAQVPAAFIGNLVFLPVRVNQGQPSLFQLDSAAVGSSIDPSRATELGVADAQSPTLNLSDLDILMPKLAEVANANFSADVGRPYEGTLGDDFLSALVVEVDYGRQTVRLYDPGPYRYSGHGKPFHLTFSLGMPVVQAKFAAGNKTMEGNFIVNTALNASVRISESFVQSHKLSMSHVKTIPVAEENARGRSLRIGRLKEFEIGPFTIQAPLGEFEAGKPEWNDPKIAGEIGGGILRRFGVVFDYTQQQMFLDPNSEFRDDESEDMSGISIIATGPGLKTFVVTQVRSGTPGADAGIQKGDVIAGVDDEAAADLSLMAIRDLFRQVGHDYKLLVERNGQTRTVTIRMRRLL
jgi:PDZ domain